MTLSHQDGLAFSIFYHNGLVAYLQWHPLAIQEILIALDSLFVKVLVI